MDLKTLEKGLRVNRAHTEDLIHQETVGFHSAHVAVILLWVYFPNMPSNRLLAAALLHDIPEGYTGDIPANVKARHTSLHEELSAVEEAWWEHEGWPDPAYQLDTDEAHLLKIADMVSLVRKCQHERSMGNARVDEMYLNIQGYLGTYYRGVMVDSQYRSRVEALLQSAGVDF